MHGAHSCRYCRGLVKCRSRDRCSNSRSLLVLCVQVQAKECTVAAILILKLGICLSKARVADLLKFNRNIVRCMLQFCGLVLEFSFLGNLYESLVLGDSIMIISRRSFSSLDAML